MKQKIVIRISMTDLKSRSKAMKIAVGVSGIESAALTGQEKDLIEVVGDGIDPVLLIRLLRKNVAHAELVSVGEVKKEANAPAKKKPEAAIQSAVVNWPSPYYYNNGYAQYSVHEVAYPSNDPSCTIM